MSTRVGRMISIEVGVANEEAGQAVAASMMGKASPQPGSERSIAGGSVLSFLRSFKVADIVDDAEPAVWVNFGVRFDSNADADPISEWLFKSLTEYGHPVALRVDTSSIPSEIGAMTRLIRNKVSKSV